MDNQGRNAHYWMEKEEKSARAKKHVSTIEGHYSAPVLDAIAKMGKVYGGDVIAPEITIINQDSVSAVLELAGKEKKAAILNFASYMSPGGKFLEGSSAQEESLCLRSNLYALLSRREDYYAWNREHKNRALYTNRALYFQDVRFYAEGAEASGRLAESVLCGVITCAAPNKYAARKYCHVTDVENTKALMSRCRFVFDVARNNEVKILILGAFGCGVFGQDAREVASIFCKLLLSENWGFESVRFAIPKRGETDENWNAFVKVFGENYPKTRLSIRT